MTYNICEYCGKEIKTEPYIFRGLSGMDYIHCGMCHVDRCTGCNQCEGDR